MDVLALLDEIQSIARTGMHYAAGPHDRERYERLLDLAVDGYVELTGLEADQLRGRFADEVGYITTKVGVQVALLDDTGRILLVRRTDDGTWSLPAGFLDPNEQPSEGVRREVAEETGFDAEIDALVSATSRLASPSHGPHSMVILTYRGRVVGGTERLPEHEVLASGWFDVDDDAIEWHLDHRERAVEAWSAYSAAVS